MSEVRKLIVGAEVRAAEDFSIVGTALSYNMLSSDGLFGPGTREQVAPGAFRDCLAAKPDVKALVNHDASKILGRTKSGTLTLTDGTDALRFRVQLNRNSQMHRDTYEAVKRGDLSECSFAFTCDDDDWKPGVDGRGNPCQIRTIKKASLLDVSVVTYPAYGENNATSAEARKALELNRTHGMQEAVAMLRKAAALMARDFRSSQMDFASAMDHAHRCAELACEISKRCYDDMMDPDCDEPGCDDEAMRAAHRMANAHLNGACEHLAMARLRHLKFKK